jgi:hypothetical protein
MKNANVYVRRDSVMSEYCAAHMTACQTQILLTARQHSGAATKNVLCCCDSYRVIIEWSAPSDPRGC